MTDKTEPQTRADDQIDDPPAKEQRITKKRLHEFIESTEDDLFRNDSEIPLCWQELRTFAGMDPLTEESFSARRVEELRKRIATKKASVDEITEFAQLSLSERRAGA